MNHDDFRAWAAQCFIKGDKIYDKAAPFRGGTQTFADEELIDFVRDTGVKTVYRLTDAGRAALDPAND